MILTSFAACFAAHSTSLSGAFVGECDFQFESSEVLGECIHLRLSDCGCCHNVCLDNKRIQFQECGFVPDVSNDYFDAVEIEYLQLYSTNVTHDGNRSRLEV